MLLSTTHSSGIASRQSHELCAELPWPASSIQFHSPQDGDPQHGFGAAQVPCRKLSTLHPSISLSVQRSQYSAAGSAWNHRRSSSRLAHVCVHVQEGFTLSSAPGCLRFPGPRVPALSFQIFESLILCEARFLSLSPQKGLYVAQRWFSGGGSQSKPVTSHILA